MEIIADNDSSFDLNSPDHSGDQLNLSQELNDQQPLTYFDEEYN
jgi:hypothetical protein